MAIAPIVYLLCEFKNRDLPSRLLIADYLLKAGYPVVVGQLWGILGAFGTECLPPGVVLFATANSMQTNEMRKAKSFGYTVVATDEEALPLAGEHILANVAPDLWEHCDVFCANSDEHKKILGDGGQIKTVGSARLEYLTSLHTTRPIAEDYVLFNTGFGLINSVWGSTRDAVKAFVRATEMDLSDPKALAEVNLRVAVENTTLPLTVDLMRWVLQTRALQIVVRPHPSENAEKWDAFFGGNPRVSLIKKSDPIPWIKHARALVHSNSTTGIEAAALGTPCVNLSTDDEWSRRFILAQLNKTVSNLTAAQNALDRALKGEQKKNKALPALLNGARNIADILISLLPPPGPVRVASYSSVVPRRQAQIDKFFATASEIGRPCAELIESVFFLEP